MTFDEIQERSIASARARTIEARKRLTPEQFAIVLEFERAIDKNLGNLLARTGVGPPTAKGRVEFVTVPPAPGEECSIAELREAGIIR
jgi:hypothetical protein